MHSSAVFFGQISKLLRKKKPHHFLLTWKKEIIISAFHQFLCMFKYQLLIFIKERLVFMIFIALYCSTFLSLVSCVTLKMDIFLLTTADNFTVLKFWILSILNKILIVPSLPATAARIISFLWFSDSFFRYCILKFTTVRICRVKIWPVWKVYELAVDVTYYNNISDKWQVKVLGFKVVMQSVNHLLFANSNT